MMIPSIQSIVQEVLATRVLTSRQQRHINTLLLREQYTSSDFAALENLFQDIQSGIVVAGCDSLVPLAS